MAHTIKLDKGYDKFLKSQLFSITPVQAVFIADGTIKPFNPSHKE